MNIDSEIDDKLRQLESKPRVAYQPSFLNKSSPSPDGNGNGILSCKNNTSPLGDIATRLRLKQVVDQSTVTVPIQAEGGDLPVIFNNMQNENYQESLTNLSKPEATVTAVLFGISDVGQSNDPDDIDLFVERFLYHFFSSRASVDGFRSKQIAQICSGDVQFEHKLRFAKIKKQEKEDFV